MIELLHEVEPLIAFLLMFSTFGLWWSTARMNHYEKMKAIQALSHDNDNMTEVAMAEINAHHPSRHDRLQQFRKLQTRRHRTRK